MKLSEIEKLDPFHKAAYGYIGIRDAYKQLVESGEIKETVLIKGKNINPDNPYVFESPKDWEHNSSIKGKKSQEYLYKGEKSSHIYDTSYGDEHHYGKLEEDIYAFRREHNIQRKIYHHLVQDGKQGPSTIEAVNNILYDIKHNGAAYRIKGREFETEYMYFEDKPDRSMFDENPKPVRHDTEDICIYKTDTEIPDEIIQDAIRISGACFYCEEKGLIIDMENTKLLADNVVGIRLPIYKLNENKKYELDRPGVIATKDSVIPYELNDDYDYKDVYKKYNYTKTFPDGYFDRVKFPKDANIVKVKLPIVATLPPENELFEKGNVYIDGPISRSRKREWFIDLNSETFETPDEYIIGGREAIENSLVVQNVRDVIDKTIENNPVTSTRRSNDKYGEIIKEAPYLIHDKELGLLINLKQCEYKDGTLYIPFPDSVYEQIAARNNKELADKIKACPGYEGLRDMRRRRTDKEIPRLCDCRPDKEGPELYDAFIADMRSQYGKELPQEYDHLDLSYEDFMMEKEFTWDDIESMLKPQGNENGISDTIPKKGDSELGDNEQGDDEPGDK